LAVDKSTSSTKEFLFDSNHKVCATFQVTFDQHFPKPGWVEHQPEDIWKSVVLACKGALEKANASPKNIATIGITNQRGTTIIWNRRDGKPIYPAIVWQDRRTSQYCEALKVASTEKLIKLQTGLVFDPYFSATKIAWILDNVPGARKTAEKGYLAFGTVDTFLLWKFTEGKIHATDATNASRTMLYDINQGIWSNELLDIFRIPKSILPNVLDSASSFGNVTHNIFGGSVSISGVLGDHQAAAFGQACFEPGMIKVTFGTGCFILLNTGGTPSMSDNKLITTIAYQLNGRPVYAIEGSIFSAGTVLQWLRDSLRLIENVTECDKLATKADPCQNIFFVPAFVGLGAPHWDPDCRDSIFGIERNTGRPELVRASLESVCFQVKDLMESISSWQTKANKMLRADGGMANSDWTMQFLADLLNIPVDRPYNLETTALGAAQLSGMHCGFYPDYKVFSKN